MIRAKLWHGGAHNRVERLDSDCTPVLDPSGALFMPIVWDGLEEHYGAARFRFGVCTDPPATITTLDEAVREIRSAYIYSAEYQAPLVLVLEKDRHDSPARRRLYLEARRFICTYKSKALKGLITVPRVLLLSRQQVDNLLFEGQPAKQRREEELVCAQSIMGGAIYQATARAVCIGDMISRTSLGARAVPASYKGMDAC